ncbi:MAG: type III pantothenate kinase, partial [Candidatus Kapaibacteriota bacterium]
SVNTEQTTKIVDFLASHKNVYIYDIRELILKQKRVNIFNCHWIGTDRILGLIGGLDEFSAPIITVDFGTAITVNTVDSNRNFIGGLIFPGAETQLKSLSQNTALLRVPRIVADKELNIIEISTENAVSTGILNCIWGGLLYILNEINEKIFGASRPPIIFTGGGFKFFNSRYQSWDYPNKYYRKNLVLSGILSLAKFERQYFIEFEDDK